MTEEYTLANDDAERARLSRQGVVLRPITERLFRAAGIGPGATVLDVGCGGGDVTALLLDLVGSSGSVVAFDRDRAQVAATSARFADAPNVRVLEATVEDPPDGSFDGVVGRLVLMYQPNLDVAVASLARSVRPGGVMAFVESNNRRDTSQALYWPQTELASKVAEWIDIAFNATAVQYLVGIRLPAAMRAAGLTPQSPYESAGMIYEGRVRVEMMTALLRSMLSVLERAGVDLAEVDIDTLPERLWEDGGEHQLTVVGPLLGVWARAS